MLIVQKYGGSSLRSAEHLLNVARKVKQAVDQGYQVVVVVSAMGDSTDALVSLAEQMSAVPSAREMDQLLSTGETQSSALMAMALEHMGIPAKSFSGRLAGIVTTYDYGKARIEHVDPKELRNALAVGLTPVVAGFQGITEAGDISTLGRGGSDLTAIAVANALGADRCEIYSDVAGVYTADPRIVPSATPLGTLSYDEMLELASQGAQVLQTQAVEFAKGQQVPIYARSTFSDDPGTVIAEADNMEKPAVTAVALNRHIAKIGLIGVPDAPGVAALLFGQLAEHGVNVELIIQAVSHNQLNDIAFTIEEQDVRRAEPIVEDCLRQLGGQSLVIDTDVAKVSAIGSGMLGRPGVAARIFQALASQGINIQMIGTSEIKISCIIAREHAEQALEAIHTAFGLGASSEMVEE
ncbi:MAG: aspartate kinase [Sulfobacillus thermosulfidooxidans]|uniref:Aspartokinase n=1 Tax=Sulfobacillus thermotolerans TaxID=338644 RepID=A0ABN5GXH7_9FIRM|nr:aspartate kinase [Sulfobacillus sp. hq2]AUW92819.1 aspartate kinase [Sulfobacillus thermotolerans]MCY0907329.1 aspartate kinase [Sulfobacillus thermotolerans]POB09964.1 aspartate kinase [Sulfobacillus sp. hq2]PSR35733.1 MAG: aspartate kinase [Sulfobacillus thermosulfidooxidans]